MRSDEWQEAWACARIFVLCVSSFLAVLAGNGKLWALPQAIVTMKEVVVSRSKRKLLYCFLGIFVSYFVYGVLQENMWVSLFGFVDRMLSVRRWWLHVCHAHQVCRHSVCYYLQKNGNKYRPPVFFLINRLIMWAVNFRNHSRNSKEQKSTAALLIYEAFLLPENIGGY